MINMEGQEITDFEFKDIVLCCSTHYELEERLKQLKTQWKHSNITSFIQNHAHEYVVIVSCMREKANTMKVL